jgi:hypothetical protein
MGWAWRTTTGTDWADASAALRMYWQSHAILLRRLMATLFALFLLDLLLTCLHVQKIPNHTFWEWREWTSQSWSADSYIWFVRPFWPFVVFLVYCFYRLPILPVRPLDVTKPYLLAKRVWLCAFGVAAAILCIIVLVVWGHPTDLTGWLWILPWASLAMFVPLFIAFRFQGQAVELSRATQFYLAAWLLTTLAMDLVQWEPLPLDSRSSAYSPESLSLVFAAALVIGLFANATRLPVVAISFVGLWITTFIQYDIFSNHYWNYYLTVFRDSYLLNVGAVCIGRIDPTHIWLVGVIQ